MSNTFTKLDYSKQEKVPIYVNKTTEENAKITLGDGESVIVLNENQAKDLKHKLGLVLDK